MKRGTLKKKQITPEKKDARKLQSAKDWAMYQDIWNEREHKCVVCSDRIYGELKNLYMDHILDKGIEKYAHLRYEKQNIAVVCSTCHCSKDGLRSERYQEIINDTKKLFNIE